MYAEIYQLPIPIYHPLIAFDRTKIMDMTRKIGTYDNSIDRQETVQLARNVLK
jgi:thiamine biosynthesis protein ThiI